MHFISPVHSPSIIRLLSTWTAVRPIAFLRRYTKAVNSALLMVRGEKTAEGNERCHAGRVRASPPLLKPAREFRASSSMGFIGQDRWQTPRRSTLPPSRRSSAASCTSLKRLSILGSPCRLMSLHLRNTVRPVPACVEFFLEHLARQLEVCKHCACAIEMHSWEPALGADAQASESRNVFGGCLQFAIHVEI